MRLRHRCNSFAPKFESDMADIPGHDFDWLYKNKILPDLRSAENVRKKIILNYSIIGAVAFAGFIVEAMTWMLIGVAAIILFIILYTRWYSIPVSRFEKLYTDAISSHLVTFISDALQIDRNSHISLSELQQAMIISGTPKNFGGQYLIHGEIQGVPLRISEINSETKMIGDSGEENLHQYFNGLVAIASIPIKIDDAILISSGNQIEKNLSALTGKIKISGTTGNELIVHMSDEQRFRQYIPTGLTDMLQRYVESTKNNIIFSIYPEGISLAISHPKGFHYLEPSVFKSAYTKHAAEIYYRDLEFVVRSVLSAAATVKQGN